MNLRLGVALLGSISLTFLALACQESHMDQPAEQKLTWVAPSNWKGERDPGSTLNRPMAIADYSVKPLRYCAICAEHGQVGGPTTQRSEASDAANDHNRSTSHPHGNGASVRTCL